MSCDCCAFPHVWVCVNGLAPCVAPRPLRRVAATPCFLALSELIMLAHSRHVRAWAITVLLAAWARSSVRVVDDLCEFTIPHLTRTCTAGARSVRYCPHQSDLNKE